MHSFRTPDYGKKLRRRKSSNPEVTARREVTKIMGNDRIAVRGDGDLKHEIVPWIF